MIKYIELKINAMAGSAASKNDVFIILKEVDGERILPIAMNRFKAMATMARNAIHLPSLAPENALAAVIEMMERFEITLKKVVLTTVKDGIFFCDIIATHENNEHSVSLCRAADGLELAVRAKCPILITDELLEAQYMQRITDNSYAMNISTVTGTMLKDALNHALQHEDYEAASKIRDELAKRNIDETN